MDQYFEYKLWIDFYIPAILCAIFIIACLFIGMCKLFQRLKDKIQNNEERKQERKKNEIQ